MPMSGAKLRRSNQYTAGYLLPIALPCLDPYRFLGCGILDGRSPRTRCAAEARYLQDTIHSVGLLAQPRGPVLHHHHRQVGLITSFRDLYQKALAVAGEYTTTRSAEQQFPIGRSFVDTCIGVVNMLAIGRPLGIDSASKGKACGNAASEGHSPYVNGISARCERNSSAVRGEAIVGKMVMIDLKREIARQVYEEPDATP